MSKSIQAFLSELNQLDIKISIEKDRLKCNAPKGALTPALQAELSSRKADIIAFLKENQAIKITKTVIKPQAERQNLPLSFAQQRLWFLDQLEGQNATYNMPGVLKLEGNLHLEALEKSLNQIIQKHESLRTRFETSNGEAIQIIDLERNLKLEIINLESLEPKEQEEQTRQLIQQEVQKPFNLSQDSLIRATLIQLGAENHIFLMTMHHIISDGWSISVLVQELTVLYSAYIQGKEADLPPLSIQYADYATWQREWLSGENLQNKIDYWKNKLSGLPQLLELPTDYPRPPKQSFKGLNCHFTLTQELGDQLKQFSQNRGVTLFMTLLSAFSLLLARYTRSQDIAIGSPIANRNQRETESLIGFFVNTLIMRVNLEDNLTVKELLQQVKTTCLEAYSHQDIPFEKLVEELKPERNLSYSPLFQVMFVLQNTPTEKLNLPGLTLSTLEINFNVAKFDLTLSMEETESGIQGNWEYNTDLFEKETIERMIGHFQVLLEGIVANPEEKIGSLPLLTELERHQILVEWNDTKVDYPKDKCIHQLFEEQVLRTPNAVAVVYEEQKLTYQKLNQKANQLAHYLQKLGVKPDSLVGICVERSLEMIVGLLGILKAGGAYVPIDPNYPTERIEYMLEDSQVQIILTQRKLKENLPEIQGSIVDLEQDWPIIATEKIISPNTSTTSQNLAYVIYTSGSTGKPKGVMLQHQGVANLAQAQFSVMKVRPSSRVLQFASFSFDASVSEMLMALLSGARLVLVTKDDLLPGDNLQKTINQYGITHITLPPSALTVMSPEALSGVETMVVAGEACPSELAAVWSKNRNFLNGYGPTEDTVCATIGEYREDLEKLPIGRPIPNNQVYILDAHFQPVPIGVPGELLIGGVGLARGYLNRPELTTEKFIQNPFDPTGQSKLYKTGDLCRYLPDGNIEYIGRIDHQVKIRGFRIELGEIESLLSSHPDIRETVVLAREDQPGNKRLVAYLVSKLIPERLPYVKPCQLAVNGITYSVQSEDISEKGIGLAQLPINLESSQFVTIEMQVPAEDTITKLSGQVAWYREQHAGIKWNLSNEDLEKIKKICQSLKEDLAVIPNLQRSLSQGLREYLKERLPDYMIPSAFVLLEKFSLTPNGKIDRKALPEPDFSLLANADDFVAPHTPQEQKLAQVWCDLLRLKQVSINSNFFELGGDSILSIQIVARAKQAGLKITPKQLFEHQTIADLALVAQQAGILEAEQGLLTGVAPLTPIQHWFFEQNLPEIYHWNQAVLLEVESNIDLEKLTKVAKAILVHHDALRFKYEKIEDNWQQSYTQPIKDFSIEIADLSEIPPTEQSAAIETQATQWQRTLNLAEGQLMRMVLFQLKENQPSRLLIVIHHLAVDGVSWRILLEDLLTAYKQLSQGKAIQFPAKTTSYRQWGRKLLEYAQSDSLKAQLDYWKTCQVATDNLPVDYSANWEQNTEASTANMTISLTPDQTSALLKKVPAAYNTQINDILLTALVQTFTQWTGQTALLLDLEGHGREDLFEGVDLSRTVGWFTSVFPLKLHFAPQGKNNLGEAIKQIKEQLRQIPEKGIGYGILRYLNPDPQIQGQLTNLPQAQISFNYLGQFDQMVSLPPILGFASESSGIAHSQHCLRRHLIDINSQVVSGQLSMAWTYSENFHRRETIETLAQNYQTNLQALIDHCQSPDAGGFTPSDFPVARLTQQQLDQLLSQIQNTNNIEDIYALSPTQQGILFHTLYSPESSVYFEQSILKLQGLLKPSAFRYAWEQVVQRHPILRTAFYEKGLEQPVQVVFKEVNLPWSEWDWRSFSATEQQQNLEQWLRQDREQGFDLTKAPLMRLTLIQLTNDTYQFIWSRHDLLLDGWSGAILNQELWSFYHAYVQDSTLQLKLPRPYRDYIGWLQQQDLAEAESFWTEKLKGFTAPTPLINDSIAQVREKSEEYQVQQAQLSRAVTDKLQLVAQQHRVTLNIIIQAAWAWLLSCYSGESDIVFGTTVSGRPPELEGIESMVGLFINTLPVRVIIPEQGSLLPWLQDLNRQYREQEPYFYTPLSKVLEWSEVPRGTELFESLVIFENYPFDAQSQGQDTNLEILESSAFERTNYPLLLLIGPGQELSFMVSYMANRFTHETIERILGHLTVILEEIASNPQISLQQLSPLTQTEKQQILFDWNDTARDYPQNRCLHQWIEAQVDKSPEATAVIFEGQSLTYSGLNAKANQLAHYLREKGVQPNSLVGICVERSLEMVIGLLGILKAGAAYVPIDPSYPGDRIAYMLQDSQVSILLTQAKLIEQLSTTKASLLCLDHDWTWIEASASDNPQNLTTVDHLAYMIYTSGSTGKPKGAINGHRGIVNRLLWMQEAYRLGESDRILQKTPFSFDVSVWEFFWPLMTGATLVVGKPEGHKDSAYLVKTIQEEQITTLHFVPSMLQVFLEEPHISDCTSLKRVICSGEALPFALQERFFSQFNCELHNLYGPTEAAIDVSYWQCQPQSSWKKVPIGRPIANTQLYILNVNLQPVPVGAVGELHIGGVQVGKGYLNRPELTAAKFIADPFSQDTQARLYKTGDLCRYLPDGNIEYIGRIDHQVKIRGFRVELGEIEAALTQHPQVETVVVLAREDQPGDKRLVAYLVPNDQSSIPNPKSNPPLTLPTPAPPRRGARRGTAPRRGARRGTDPRRGIQNQLRDFLKQKLPDYMIPSAFVLLPSLPLTPNGKLDRRALPVPTTLTRGIDHHWIAPRDTLEQKLVQIWEDILNVFPIGVQDSFFDLGGHSLVAIRLISKISQDFQQLLPLASLFQYSTVEQLANLLRSANTVSSWSPLVAIQPHGQGIPFFCVPGVGGNVIYLYNLAKALGAERPFYGLQSVGLDGRSNPLTRVEDMAAEYIKAIQTVQSEGPYLLGGHSFGGAIAFEMAQQLQTQGQKVALVAIFDSLAPQYQTEPLGTDWNDATCIGHIIEIINTLWGIKLETVDEVLQQLSGEEQLYYLKDCLQQANLIAPSGDIFQVKGLLEVFKANCQICYQPHNPIPTPIALFRAREDTTDMAASENENKIEQDSSLGWQQWATASMEVQMIPGSHLTMMIPPYVQVLADYLKLSITQSLASN